MASPYRLGKLDTRMVTAYDLAVQFPSPILRQSLFANIHATEYLDAVHNHVRISSIDKQLKSGKLCDIAPTMLALAHIDKPSNMTGESLLLD